MSTELEKIKTSALAIATLIYGLGILTWSMHAFINSLGLISVFDTQYFFAGLIPFVLLLIVYLLFRLNFNLSKYDKKIKTVFRRFGKESENTYTKLKKKILAHLFVTCLIIWAVVVVLLKLYQDQIYISISVFIVIVASYLFILYRRKIFRPLSKLPFKQKRILVRGFRYYKFFILLIFKLQISVDIIILIALYVMFVYPEIPQELGGGQPKKCVLECKKGTFSNEITNKIFENSTEEIYRSKEVYVFYYNNEKILFKEDISRFSPVYEVRRNDIVLMNWIQ